MKRVGQGAEERLHPGTPTFGHTQASEQVPANQHEANPSGESTDLNAKHQLNEGRSSM